LETVVVSATALTYAASPTQTLLPSGQAPLELPRSLTVLSGDYLRDRAPQSLGEALRGVPGVGITQGEGHRDALVLRGVATTSDLLLDGLRDDVQYLRDLYSVQQIEVLTGANAVLVGHSGGGGSVNRVTKQAGGRHHEYVLQGSSQNGLRMTADLGDEAADLGSARVNLLWEDSGSFRDDVRLSRKGVAPVLSVQLAPALALSGGGELFADNRTVDRGVPSLDGRPLDTPVGRY
jgi:catecholate siderophore receptor